MATAFFFSQLKSYCSDLEYNVNKIKKNLNNGVPVDGRGEEDNKENISISSNDFAYIFELKDGVDKLKERVDRVEYSLQNVPQRSQAPYCSLEHVSCNSCVTLSFV